MKSQMLNNTFNIQKGYYIIIAHFVSIMYYSSTQYQINFNDD